MEWYKDYKLIEDDNGYTLEIFLNNDDTEVSEDFLLEIKKSVLQLDDKIKKFADDNFSGIKINTVKLLVGTMMVATIPFATLQGAEAATTTTTQTATTSLSTTGTVTASKLNVRSGPSTSYSIIHVLWNGNVVKVIGQSNGWYQIKLSDGRTGWVSQTYLSVNATYNTIQQKIDTVISTAKSLIGTPYVWGGESPAEGGFDCSGFTQYVFGKAGYQLNRISADQAKQGIAVSWANLKPGDLMFSGFNKDGVINHVGIYIGNGQMIHSPKAGDTVKVTNVNTTYWQGVFVTARRIIY